MKKLGVDIGAGNIKAVLVESIENRANIIKAISKKVEGKPIKKTLEVLDEICDGGEYEVGITGINGRIISKLADMNFVLDAVAVLRGLEIFYPDVKTVFDIGKENSSYYFFRKEGRRLILEDFSTNSMCGAGGGALIEKMSKRLQFQNLDDFVNSAYSAETVANISARCAVFAESDVVHHYQRGSTPNEIAAGLCQVLSRNFADRICKNKKIVSPIYFLGGVSKNKAVVKFLEQKLNQKIIVPDNSLELKAIGAAVEAKQKTSKKEIIEKLSSYKPEKISGIKALTLESSLILSLPYEVIAEENGNKTILSLNKNYNFSRNINSFLGLDVGSVSTKAVLIDENGEFMLGVYGRTSGKPIEAVKDVIGNLGEIEIDSKSGRKKIKNFVEVLGAGTTGSGRDVAAEIIGADNKNIKNEITTQAKGAAYFVHDVDTVFEIGGQDSKYIFRERGINIDNEMNKACAASTGSFLEEQAEILRINIEKEFENHALNSKNPCNLAEKCTVFIESSLLSFQDSPIEDRCAGLSYSIVYNYLNRVVGKKNIGDKIVFQGAVAFNKAVVSGFETLLGKRIYVPEYPHLTGAIGIAKISKERYDKKTKV